MFLLRFLRPTPIAHLQGAPAGRKVIIEGRVVAQQTLPLGVAHLACVWYDNLVESMKAGLRGSRALWFVEKAECRFCGFWVEDASGRIWVGGDPREVEKHLYLRIARWIDTDFLCEAPGPFFRVHLFLS